MKPGDRIYWLKGQPKGKGRVKVPAIFLGHPDRLDRDSVYVYVLDALAQVRRRAIRITAILPRTEERDIDKAAAGLALYVGKAPTLTQLAGLQWLKANGGLEVGNMNMDGRSKEWPTKTTLEGLLERKLIDVEQLEFTWKASINDLGEEVLKGYVA